MQNSRAYKAVGSCIYAKLYGSNQPILQTDGSYACEGDYYLKIEYSENDYP